MNKCGDGAGTQLDRKGCPARPFPKGFRQEAWRGSYDVPARFKDRQAEGNLGGRSGVETWLEVPCREPKRGLLMFADTSSDSPS